MILDNLNLDNLDRWIEQYELAIKLELKDTDLDEINNRRREEIKCIALDHAFQMVSNLRTAYDAYNTCLSAWRRLHPGQPGFPPDDSLPELELLGRMMQQNMARICKRLLPKKRKVKSPSRPTANRRSNSAAGQYERWAMENDKMPSDAACSNFSGGNQHKPGAYSKARSRLKERGYEFEKLESGEYTIISRPRPASIATPAADGPSGDPKRLNLMVKVLEKGLPQDVKGKLLALIENPETPDDELELIDRML